MPTQERVNEFIQTVVEGHHVDAILNFYHENASMQENDSPPREGRAALVEYEEKSLRRIQGIESRLASPSVTDGDRVVIHWVFTATDKKGVRYQLEELSLQTWVGDRILVERFFYDSAKAWQPLEAASAE